MSQITGHDGVTLEGVLSWMHAVEISWLIRYPQIPLHNAKRERLARMLERYADVARTRTTEPR